MHGNNIIQGMFVLAVQTAFSGQLPVACIYYVKHSNSSFFCKPYQLTLFMNINKQVDFINGLSDFLKVSGSFYYCIMKGENKPHGWQSGGPQSAVCFSCAALSWFWFNPFNPKILLVILLNGCHTIPMILVLRICYQIN